MNAEEAKELVIGLKSMPCMDCVAVGRSGVWPVECMDFDHLPDRGAKEAEIGDLLLLKRYDLLELELAKCEVVCSNCHRIRTKARRKIFVRHKWFRPDGGPRRSDGEAAWREVKAAYRAERKRMVTAG